MIANIESRMRARAVAAALMASGLGLAACAPNYGTNTYSHGSVGDIHRIEEAIVVSSRPVTIDSGNSGVGAVSGAAIGGAIGVGAGGDTTGEIVGGVLGAVLGGLLGNAIDENVNERDGIAYTVRLTDTDELVTIVQGDDIYFAEGSPVYVEYGDRPRIVPRPPRRSAGYYPD